MNHDATTIDDLYKYDKIKLARDKKYDECYCEKPDGYCWCETHYFTVTNQSFLNEAFTLLQHCNNIKELFLWDLGLNDDTNLTFPPLLEWLDISRNRFTKLPNIPETVKILVCSRNKLTSIDLLANSKLERLFCGENKISTLDNLPGHIWELDCSNNQIEFLENLPSSCRHLNCSNNQINALNNLPYGITLLDCHRNPISSLDNLPTSITWLKCYNCKLVQIDNLPAKLQILQCNDNKIAKINKLPEKLRSIDYKGNPFYDDEDTRKLIDKLIAKNKYNEFY